MNKGKYHDQHLELAEYLAETPPEDIQRIFDISCTYAEVVKSAAKRIETLLNTKIDKDEIANRLDITKPTVYAYLSALRKIGVLR